MLVTWGRWTDKNGYSTLCNRESTGQRQQIVLVAFFLFLGELRFIFYQENIFFLI